MADVGLDGPIATAFRAGGARRKIRAGHVIFTEASAPRDVFLITRGRVKCSAVAESGRESVLAVRGPGDLLGELSALDGAPRSAAAVTIDTVEVLAVSDQQFIEILGRSPGAGLELVRILSARLRESDRQRAEFGSHDSIVRVARRLVELAGRFGADAGGQIRIDLPLTQEELAGWTGSSREAVAKALRVLRAEQLIETGRRVVTVTDPSGLRRRALL